MNKSFTKLWKNSYNRDLAKSLITLPDLLSVQKFLGDIMTEKEISEISARLKAAKMLSEGQKYNEIINKTSLSSRTVARISKWLKSGYGGYQLVINNQNHPHIKPVSAD